MPHTAHTAHVRQRRLLLALPACLPACLAACASPLPALRWVRLPLLAPGAVAAPTRTAAAEPWQLMAPVRLPGHLDQDALLLPSGAAGLQPLAGVRWAEPLRDAVPRLLQHDLGLALGTPLWAAPLPPGVLPRWQLRIDIGAFDVAPGGRAVLLQARWSLADAAGRSPPRLGDAAFSVAVDLVAGVAADGHSADALALAHRSALWQLAQRIAATP